LADFAELTDRKQEIERILRQLSTGETRIFKAVPNRQNPQSPFYEVSHDALGPAILSWRRRINDIKLNKLELQKAEEKRRKELAVREAELEEERRHKEEQAHKLKEEQERRENQERLLEAERKSRKLGRIIVALATLFTLAVVIAGGWFYKYRRDKEIEHHKEIIERDVVQKKIEVEKKEDEVEKKEDEVEEKKIEVEKQEANVNTVSQLVNKQTKTATHINEKYEEQINRYKSLIGILASLQSGKTESVNIALSQLEKKANDSDLPNEYKRLFIEVLNNTRAATPEIEKKLADTRAAVERSQARIEKPTGDNPIIIFIHVQQEDPNADKLRAVFRKKGYVAPGVENVGLKPSIKQPQVRYFRDSDAGIADQLCSFLARYGIKAEKLFIRGYENSPLVRPHQFELWLTADLIPEVR
jgi:hypothetical protein